ncbi:MAG: MFS transporter [Chloroflexi bacterium]|nr:MFS transporter [Chloroflexota bacterium]
MATRYWPLFVLSVVGFTTSFGAHIVAVNLPVYAREVGVGVAVIGILIAVYDLAEVVAKPVFGYAADRRGKKVTMLLGLGVFSLASMLFLLVDPRLLLAVRFLQGLGAAAFSVISLSLIAEHYTEKRGQAYGIYNACKGAGYVLSPMIGGAIVFASDFRMLFVACAGVGLVSLLLSLTLQERQRSAGLDDDGDDLDLKAMAAAFADRALLPWYLVIITNMFLVGILFGFLPVYATSLGYDPLRVGALVSVATLSNLLVQPLAGHLADRLPAANVVTAGVMLSAVTVAILPLTDGWLLIGVVALAGMGAGTVWTNTDTLVSRLAREKALAASIGTAGSFKEIGDMLGPLFVGGLAQVLGLPPAFAICGVLALGSLATVRLARPAAVRGMG